MESSVSRTVDPSSQHMNSPADRRVSFREQSRLKQCRRRRRRSRLPVGCRPSATRPRPSEVERVTAKIGRSLERHSDDSHALPHHGMHAQHCNARQSSSRQGILDEDASGVQVVPLTSTLRYFESEVTIPRTQQMAWPRPQPLRLNISAQSQSIGCHQRSGCRIHFLHQIRASFGVTLEIG